MNIKITIKINNSIFLFLQRAKPSVFKLGGVIKFCFLNKIFFYIFKKLNPARYIPLLYAV